MCQNDGCPLCAHLSQSSGVTEKKDEHLCAFNAFIDWRAGHHQRVTYIPPGLPRQRGGGQEGRRS